jgi:hypothetical protein
MMSGLVDHLTTVAMSDLMNGGMSNREGEKRRESCPSYHNDGR